jgi:hypothetical protein
LSSDDVIAMASIDDQIEIISDTVNSIATNYASMSSLLFFGSGTKLIDELRGLGIVP